MKSLFIKIFLLSSLKIILSIAPMNDTYTLVFDEEFLGKELDTSKWEYDIGTGNWGWGNNELQYYTDRKENVFIENNMLHIRAKKEYYSLQKYTSGRIKTSGKFSFQYGIVKIRMKVPKVKGLVPAFWMLGRNFDTAGWPNCGEIDIMETKNEDGKVYANCHWDSNGHADYSRASEEFNIEEFHIYTLSWDKEYIRVFVDDKMYYEILIKDGVGNTEEFHKPFFLIITLAVGGQWPGYDIDERLLPSDFVIDYIRVYQDSNNINVSETQFIKFPFIWIFVFLLIFIF